MSKTTSAFLLCGLMGFGLSVAWTMTMMPNQASPLLPQITPTLTNTPTPCPVTTPEQLLVEPINSPTTGFSQVVTIHIGYREWVRVATESGVFTSTEAQVNVTLLTDTLHTLAVTGKVARVGSPPGCVYGDYTLSTTVDRNGKPLVIQQRALHHNYWPMFFSKGR